MEYANKAALLQGGIGKRSGELGSKLGVGTAVNSTLSRLNERQGFSDTTQFLPSPLTYIPIGFYHPIRIPGRHCSFSPVMEHHASRWSEYADNSPSTPNLGSAKWAQVGDMRG